MLHPDLEFPEFKEALEGCPELAEPFDPSLIGTAESDFELEALFGSDFQVGDDVRVTDPRNPDNVVSKTGTVIGFMPGGVSCAVIKIHGNQLFYIQSDAGDCDPDGNDPTIERIQ